MHGTRVQKYKADPEDDLILPLNLSNLPWQRFSYPCKDHSGLGIFPGWLSFTQWPKGSILRLYNFSTQLPQTLPKGKREMDKAHCSSTLFAWRLVTCIENPLARTSHMAPTQPQRRVGRVRECMHILGELTASVIMLLLLQASAQRAPRPWSSTSCPFPRTNCFILLYSHSILIYTLIAKTKAQVI